jgi:hypothetical protein
VDIVGVTRACSNVLVAVAERWNTQRHCHEVFDRLSDAILMDAVKLQAATGQSNQAQSVVSSPATSSHSPTSPIGATGPAQQANYLANISNPNHISFWQNQQNQHQAQMQSRLQQAQAQFNNHGQAPPAPPTQLAVDSEFMHCYGDIQQLYQQQQVEDPVMHLSQEWMAYLGNGGGPAGGYVTYGHSQQHPNHHPSAQQAHQQSQATHQHQQHPPQIPSQYQGNQQYRMSM